MATKLKVTYNDGREVTVIASPRAQVMTEQHFKAGIGDANRVQAGFFLAWASLNRAGKEPAEFDAWLDLISDVDDAEAGEEETDPTPAVQSTTGLSD
jgi:hypothetical protein